MLGQEDQFPPPRLSAGCGFRKETFAGAHGNGRVAPIPDLPVLPRERGGSTEAVEKRVIRGGRRVAFLGGDGQDVR